MTQNADNMDDEERAFREKAREEARARLAARSQQAGRSPDRRSSGERDARHRSEAGWGDASSRQSDGRETSSRRTGASATSGSPRSGARGETQRSGARQAEGSSRSGSGRQAGQSRVGSRAESSRSGGQSTDDSFAGKLLAVLAVIAGFLVDVGRAIWHGLTNLFYWIGDRRPYSYAVVAVVAIVLAVGVGSCSRSCSSDQPAIEPSSSESVESSDTGDTNAEGDQWADESTEPSVDFSQVPDTVDAAVVENLRTLAQTDQRIVDIVNNVAAYANIGNGGADEQAKLLELASDDPEAIDFVHDLPDNYPSAAQAYDGKVARGTFPRLYQWDKRWGYSTYCGRDFGTTGCCPTVMSMVYMGIEGKSDVSPADMATFATNSGYVDEQSGTYGNFVDAVGDRYGWTYYDFAPDSSALTQYLQNGYVVVINLGPGDFTTSGHFILATGLDQDGKLIINDPYSSVRSGETWDVDRVANQAIRMTAFKA